MEIYAMAGTEKLCGLENYRTLKSGISGMLKSYIIQILYYFCFLKVTLRVPLQNHIEEDLKNVPLKTQKYVQTIHYSVIKYLEQKILVSHAIKPHIL